MATVWSVDKITALLDKLKEKGHTGIPNLMTYLLVPYTASAGHDPYDFDSAEILLDEGKVVVKIAEDLSLVVSLTMEFPYEETHRMFLHIDEADRTMTLYFKVLDDWEKVTELDMTARDAQQMYGQISKYLVKERLRQEYGQKGNRMLTENVVNRQLGEGNWSNDFLRNVLIQELQEPSDELVSALANRLINNYTTKDKPWVTERLEAMKSEGLGSMVAGIVEQGMLDTAPKYTYKPKPQEVEKPKQEVQQAVKQEPKQEKEQEQEVVKEMPKAEPKPVDTKPEVKNVQPFYTGTKDTNETGEMVDLTAQLENMKM